MCRVFISYFFKAKHPNLARYQRYRFQEQLFILKPRCGNKDNRTEQWCTHVWWRERRRYVESLHLALSITGTKHGARDSKLAIALAKYL